MTKEELLALGVNEEQAKKIVADQEQNFVPASKFQEIQKGKKALDAQLADRDKQLKDLQAKAGDNDELKKQIQTLQDDNKKAEKKYKAELHQIALNNAIDKALTSARARNNKAVRALLDMDGVDLDEDGKLIGVSKQLKKLAEDEGTKFLFKEENTTGGNTKLSGMAPIRKDGGGDAGGSLGAQFAAAYNSMVNPVSNGDKGGN